MRAIVVERHGGPEVLELAEIPDPEAGAGETACSIWLAGVNFADTHWTDGTYLANQRLPFIPGTNFVGQAADGRRVCGSVTGGAYAERIAAPNHKLWTVPDEMADGDAVALMIHGCAAWHVLRIDARVQKGESVVVQAAAGGVGSFAVQLAKRWGAGRVIAMASTEEKRKIARELGADATVDSDSEQLTAALLEANNGRPINVVLDVTGGPTFDQCLATLGEGGRIVTFGSTSRQPASPIRPESLMDGSRSVIGYWLRKSPEPILTALSAMVLRGEVKPLVGDVFPLEAARTVHERLLARATTGVQLLDARR